MPGEDLGVSLPRQASDADRFRGTAAGPSLDRLADLARRLLGTEAAQVSLLTDVQLVAGAAGAAVAGSTGPLADSLCTVTAAHGAPLVVARADTDARVATLPPVISGAVASYLGVPIVTLRGETVGALCAYDPQPRTWDDGDVELLTQLARSVVAELELSAVTGEYRRTAARWELAIDAAGVGSFDWDLHTGELVWDARLLSLFGYRPDAFGRSIEDFNARVHPTTSSG